MAMDGRAEKVSMGWERCVGVILLNFNTPCIFPFVGLKSVAYAYGHRRESEEFFLGFSFLAGGAGTSLQPWTEGQRRYQWGGKGAKMGCLDRVTDIPGNNAYLFFAFFWLTKGSRNKN